MTLAEAISTMAVAGCRLVPDHAGGLALVVPDGTTMPRQVLEVLRVHREQLVAAHAVPPAPPAAPADDLGEYLREKGLGDSTADFVVYAAKLFGVPGQKVTIEAVVAEAEPELFEPGIPMQTTIATTWHKRGVGYFNLPAGTAGLLIPQLWAIADADARKQVEATIANAKRRGRPKHVAAWLAGEPRALEIDALTIEGVVLPAGMDRIPWRAGAVAA
jgi:hypothetical protein